MEYMVTLSGYIYTRVYNKDTDKFTNPKSSLDDGYMLNVFEAKEVMKKYKFADIKLIEVKDADEALLIIKNIEKDNLERFASAIKKLGDMT